MIKKLFLALLVPLLAFASYGAEAPFTIKGRVTDTAGAAVGYATVAAYRDSVLVNAAAADAEGAFAVTVPQKGDYTLRTSAVGYAENRHPVVVESVASDAGKIVLEPGVEIADVVVAAQKPLITSDAEKMTYEVENDPQASTGTLEEIIRKVPQLSLDADGNVLLNGQSNYKILLNGHQASSLSRNFKDIIKSMPASQIKRIEVITNPSIKYDAEGAGGIINIITQKKRSFDGYNGSVAAGTSFMGHQGEFANANFSVQSGKFAVGASGYYNNYKSPENANKSNWSQENLGSEEVKRMDSRSTSHSKGRSYGFSLDLSYQPDTLNLITLSGSLWTGLSRGNSLSALTATDAQGQPLFNYDQSYDTRFKYIGGTLGFSYERVLGREGHTLTFSDELNIDPDDYDVERRVVWNDGRTLLALQSEPTRSVENTFQVDYNNPITEHHRIEVGAKYIFRSNRIEDAFTTTESDAAPELRTTQMEYSQQVLALYAGYGVTFKKWSGRAGARLESTWSDASGIDKEAYAFKNRMFNVIPYASLTYLPSEGHNFSFTYTQRLSRPSIEMLSPVVNDTDPIMRSYGNSDLTAATYNSLTLQYNYFSTKWSATFALNSFLSNNEMDYYTFVDGDGLIHSTVSNDVRSRSYGFNGSFSFRPSQKFSLSFNYQGGYSRSELLQMAISTDMFSFSEGLFLDFAVWKGARVMLGQNYTTGYAGLGSKSGGYYFYYGGLKQKFLKERLEVAVTLYNPFEKDRSYTSTEQTPTYIRFSDSCTPARSINIRASFRFGKQGIGVKSTSRSIENDDLQSSSKGGGGQ